MFAAAVALPAPAPAADAEPPMSDPPTPAEVARALDAVLARETPQAPAVPLGPPSAPNQPTGQRVMIDSVLPPIPPSTWSPPPNDDGMSLLTSPPYSAVAVKNGADGATSPGVTREARFTLHRALQLDQIMTYHYGARRKPGTIALRHSDGTVYGPWLAGGAVGQGDVAYAYWWARPDIPLKPGRYTILDSDPASWSTEAATRGAGIFVIWGRAIR